MSSASVSSYFTDRQQFDNHKLFLDHSCLPGGMSMPSNSYDIQKPSPSPHVNMVNHFPRARGFSTSAMTTSAGQTKSTPSMPYTLNLNTIDSLGVTSRSDGMRRVDRSFSMNDATDIRNSRNVQQQQQSVNSSRYKTELCRPFEENGHCKYGEKCQFAHGMQELRNLARHPKYKTELCRTYHTVGFCPYGPRCHFVHNEEEVKKSGALAINSAEQVASRMPSSMSLRQHTSHHLRNTAYNPLSISLGSSAESSPPSSLSGSPSTSPTFFEDVVSLSSSCSSNSSSYCAPPGFSPMLPCRQMEAFPAATTANSNIFNFAALTNELSKVYSSPLDQRNQNSSLTMLAINRINNCMLDRTAMLADRVTGVCCDSSTTMLDRSTCLREDVFSVPPSPPDSVAEDAIVGSLTDRLPIFRRLSLEEMLAAHMQ